MSFFGVFASPRSDGGQLGARSPYPHEHTSPYAHGFAGGATGVRFNPDVTLHTFSPDVASSLAGTSPSVRLSPAAGSASPANMPLGRTPMLPEERATSFSKWCSARRTRVNESEDLRRKSAARGALPGAVAVPAHTRGLLAGLEDSSREARRSSVGSGSAWAEGGAAAAGRGKLLGQAPAADRWCGRSLLLLLLQLVVA